MKNKVFIFLAIFALTSFSQIKNDVLSFSLGRLPNGIFGLNYQYKISTKSAIGLYWHSSLHQYSSGSVFQEPSQPTDFMVSWSYYFKETFDMWSISPVTGISFVLANHSEIPLLAEIAHQWVFRNTISLQVGGAFGTGFVFNNWQYKNSAFRCFGICDIGYLF
jgi:hypothetical protein